MAAPRPPGRHAAATRGMVLPLLLGVLMAAVVVWCAGWQADAAARAGVQAGLQRQRALQRAAEVLRDWYRDHLAELDSPGSLPPDPAAALAGVAAAAGVRVALGELGMEGEVPGRRLLGWVGPVDTATEGTTLVDGHALEREALLRARRQLRALAGRLEIWFRAHAAADPLHQADRNWWRPADPACLAQRDELPCLPDYTELRAVAGLGARLALSDDALRMPWGACCPLEASNGVDASDTVPYTLALRVRTPWHALLQARAVQPGAAP